jgi:NADPH:quinone reductase-like Zn-dependent oxidoreductase
MPPALLIARLNEAPGHAREFEDWYTHVHLRDVLRMPGSVSAQRFRRLQPHAITRPSPGFTYLPVYDVDDPEGLSAAHAAAAGTDRMVMSAAADLRKVSIHYFYPRMVLGAQPWTIRGPAAGALLIEYATADPTPQRQAARLLHSLYGTLPGAAPRRGLLAEFREEAQVFRRPPAATLLCLLQFACEPEAAARQLTRLLDQTARSARITLFGRQPTADEATGTGGRCDLAGITGAVPRHSQPVQRGEAALSAARDEGIALRYYHFPAFTGIDALKMGERDVPAPGSRDVLLRMHAWSLNYRDLLISEGRYGRSQKPDVVPLSDGAGKVVAVGDEVTRWRVGDRVMPIFMPNWITGPPQAQRIVGALGGPADGLLAEYAIVPESAVVSVPEHLSWAQAATLPCAALTAWHTVVTHGQAAPGQIVLTLGTGGVSLFALQFARLAGAGIVATSSSDAKLARLAELGAGKLVNYLTTANWGAEVQRINSGGVDHVVDVGGSGTIDQSVAATRMGGRVSVIGVLTDGGGTGHDAAPDEGHHCAGDACWQS